MLHILNYVKDISLNFTYYYTYNLIKHNNQIKTKSNIN